MQDKRARQFVLDTLPKSIVASWTDSVPSM
jgi:hypothetical protein